MRWCSAVDQAAQSLDVALELLNLLALFLHGGLPELQHPKLAARAGLSDDEWGQGLLRFDDLQRRRRTLDKTPRAGGLVLLNEARLNVPTAFVPGRPPLHQGCPQLLRELLLRLRLDANGRLALDPQDGVAGLIQLALMRGARKALPAQDGDGHHARAFAEDHRALFSQLLPAIHRLDQEEAGAVSQLPRANPGGGQLLEGERAQRLQTIPVLRRQLAGGAAIQIDDLPQPLEHRGGRFEGRLRVDHQFRRLNDGDWLACLDVDHSLRRQPTSIRQRERPDWIPADSPRRELACRGASQLPHLGDDAVPGRLIQRRRPGAVEQLIGPRNHRRALRRLGALVCGFRGLGDAHGVVELVDDRRHAELSALQRDHPKLRQDRRDGGSRRGICVGRPRAVSDVHAVGRLKRAIRQPSRRRRQRHAMRKRAAQAGSLAQEMVRHLAVLLSLRGAPV